MEKKETLFSWLMTMMAAIVLTGMPTACDSDEDATPSVEVGETVTDFVKVTQYEDSKTFQSDLDALVTCAFDLNSFRLCWLLMVSNGFEDDKLFCATAKELDEDKYGYGEVAWDILAHIVENSETYKEALERLETSGVLSKANETRGLSDMFDFFRGSYKSLTMGRKSVVAIINKAGWGSNPVMMQDLYDALPSSTRRGYSTATEFWKAYSNGEIDTRTNVVFSTLYTTQPAFREKAMELGVTPSRNLGIVGAQLINSGLSLVVDAIPGSLGGFASGFGYGKDIYGSIEAGYELAKNRDWKSVKNYVQNGINGAATYLPYLINLRNGNGWTGLDLFDDFDKTIAQGAIINITSNYEDYLKEIFGKEEGIITNPVTAKDKNGNPINLTIIQDQNTGQIVIGLPTDNSGMIICNPKKVGMKVITVVNKNSGKRKTKVVKIGDEPEEVSFDLEHDERELEENPKNGILKLERNPLTDDGYGGNFKVMIETNYLYYTCKTDSSDKWISARVGKDINYLYVQLTKNDTGKERTGHVTVAATDSKGKVLKSTVLTVKQTPPPVYEEWVNVSPSSLQFDAKGGRQEVEVTHSNALNYTVPVIGDDLAEWCNLNWKETETGWNIVVDVNPNNTGKERSGSFIVYAAASEKDRERAVKEGVFDKSVVQADTVFVKQSAESQSGKTPSVSPTSLTFEAEGGTQSVKVTTAGYRYFGCIIDDAAKSWLSRSYSEGGTIELTAQSNTTGKERSTTLRCYATNSQKGTDEDTYYMDVRITQKAGKEQTSTYQLVSGSVGMGILTGIDGNNDMGGIEFKATDNYVTVSQNGKGLHVDINYKVNEKDYKETIICQFDIDDLTLLNSNKSKVTNLSWKVDTDNKGGRSWAGVWAVGGWGWIKHQTQKIRFSTSSKIPQTGFESIGNESISVGWYAENNNIKPSECSYYRSSETVSEDVGTVIDEGKEMKSGSISISLVLKKI